VIVEDNVTFASPPQHPDIDEHTLIVGDGVGCVGDAVGTNVGTTVGDAVGTNVGDAVGTNVGAVGTNVGTLVGADVGFIVGLVSPVPGLNQ